MTILVINSKRQLLVDYFFFVSYCVWFHKINTHRLKSLMKGRYILWSMGFRWATSTGPIMFFFCVNLSCLAVSSSRIMIWMLCCAKHVHFVKRSIMGLCRFLLLIFVLFIYFVLLLTLLSEWVLCWSRQGEGQVGSPGVWAFVIKQGSKWGWETATTTIARDELFRVH